ncbi:hypothetical protein [Rhodovulum sulfidophilum]|uniref:hypothetical protein n=1 Tax=Rhodovulum sulfidophilum TaxID=35806 RepID=UPI001EE4CEFE|nr:hypothetical protein [Rhodovulum sulfidophilum]
MTARTSGFRATAVMLRTLPKSVERKIEAANAENAEDLMRTAKVLIPEKTGKARRLIKAMPQGDGGVLVDFGPLSKILEGGTEERHHKDGKSTGKGPARPFVNPALQVTEKRRKNRARKAVRDAIREVKGNG